MTIGVQGCIAARKKPQLTAAAPKEPEVTPEVKTLVV